MGVNFFFVGLLICAFLAPAGMASDLVLQDLDYSDHLQTLPNYDRGFYRPQVLHIKPSGTAPVTTPYGKLLHLRAEISEFSSNAWLRVDSAGGVRDTIRGVSRDLTEDALNALQTSFDNIRAYGGKVIVRICYDPWYNGRRNVTPEHKWVLRHVEQLAPVLSKNVDVIVALEMGMHGAYGEMHSDTSITYPRVAEAVNLMLRLTPQELKILTRTGNYSAAVLGFENWGVDFNIDSDVFKRIAEVKGDTMFRVGMFNDGYLGTEYDYGTWGSDCATSICREEGVAWLEKYSVHTPYGGEALTTASGYQVINTPEFLSYEGFRTHTSYLNVEWNYNLINSWKSSHFTGADFEYDGAAVDSLTGFKYVEDHLGYRFVLRESRLLDTVDGSGKFKAELKIQNVGFGNLTKSAKAKIVLVEDLGCDDVCPDACPREDSVAVDFDLMNVLSRKIQIANGDTVMTFDGTNEISLEGILTKKEVTSGRFHVYLKAGETAFANQAVAVPNCNPDAAMGLYLGTVYVDLQKEPAQSIHKAGSLPASEGKNRLRVERAGQKIQIRGRSLEERKYRIDGARL